jgi:hypothetical protein
MTACLLEISEVNADGQVPICCNPGCLPALCSARFRLVADDPTAYRLPLLIEGKVVYTTVDAADLEDFSLSLALDDLLIRHKVTKGRFRSDDPVVWKRILVEESRKAREHLQLVELPAVKNRIDEQDQETRRFEAQRDKLYGRYKTLQQRAGGV